MRIVTTIVLFWFTFPVTADGLMDEMELASYADSKQFLFEVTGDGLRKAPSWRPEEDHPPLSARRAQKLARQKVDQWVSDGRDWDSKRIWLQDMGDGVHWIYVVEFDDPTPRRRGWHEGFARLPFRIVVLMDGTVVQPAIKEKKAEGIPQ